jgi:hypothetical protein
VLAALEALDSRRPVVTASAEAPVRLVVAGAGRSPDGGGPGSTVALDNAQGSPGGHRRAEVGWSASTGRRGWPSRRCPWHLRVRRGRGHIRRGRAGPDDLGGKRGPGYVRRHIPGCAICAPAAASAAARGTGGQLVTVTAASYGATQAKLTAYQRSGGRWRRIFGPWVAWIGRNGIQRVPHRRDRGQDRDRNR